MTAPDATEAKRCRGEPGRLAEHQQGWRDSVIIPRLTVLIGPDKGRRFTLDVGLNRTPAVHSRLRRRCYSALAYASGCSIMTRRFEMAPPLRGEAVLSRTTVSEWPADPYRDRPALPDSLPRTMPRVGD